MTAIFYVGDAIQVMNRLPEKSVDLILTSPPFLALRSYLPADHPDKALEGGSQATPGEYIDWLLDVVEACARVLDPHGSLCFELGDTYSGSGGAGGDYDENGLREGQPTFRQVLGNGWPLAKSLSLIPETFRWSMVYGHNPHTGRTTQPWRLRNVIRWVRPNPPVGALGDKFRPATSELMVFCKSKDRFFDLDAVREPHVTGLDALRPREGIKAIDTRHIGGNSGSNPAGAPPLDWWNIPPGGYAGTTMWTEKKLVDPRESVGDIWRTTSADCPIHVGPPDLVATGLHDEPESSDHPDHNSDTSNRHALGPLTGSVPIAPQPLQFLEVGSSDSLDLQYAPAATRRSKASNKTAHAPATTPVDTPSDKTTDRIDGKPIGRQSVEPHPDIPESRTSGACRDGCSQGSCDHSFDRSSEPFDEACTCSYWVNEAKSTSHYAVWPPELLVKPIKAMCPEKVCRRCGEATRRVVSEPRFIDRRGVDMTDSPRPARGYEGNQPVPKIPGASWGPVRTVETLGFTDCGHNDHRLGTVLDPFAGSGTTLLVATGHGRDAIGIDLDERNYELSLDRVGPLILQRGEIRDGTAP